MLDFQTVLDVKYIMDKINRNLVFQRKSYETFWTDMRENLSKKLDCKIQKHLGNAYKF